MEAISTRPITLVLVLITAIVTIVHTIPIFPRISVHVHIHIIIHIIHVHVLILFRLVGFRFGLRLRLRLIFIITFTFALTIILFSLRWGVYLRAWLRLWLRLQRQRVERLWERGRCASLGRGRIRRHSLFAFPALRPRAALVPTWRRAGRPAARGRTLFTLGQLTVY